MQHCLALTDLFLSAGCFQSGEQKTKWVNPWLLRRQTKCTVVDSWEVFLTLARKHSEDYNTKPPLSEVPEALYGTELVMSSVWITLGSQTHVRPRLHLPLLFASTPYPLMTSWRSARLYIMSDTEDSSAVHEKSYSYQPSWSSCVRYMHWIPSVLCVCLCLFLHTDAFLTTLKTNPLSVLFTSYHSPPWKLVPGKILLASPEWMFATKKKQNGIVLTLVSFAPAKLLANKGHI